MAASRRQHRKRKTDTYTVPEAGKPLKIGRNQAYAAAKPGEQNRPARRPKQTRRRLGRPQRLK
jgi:hypothetical protein